MSRYGDYFRAQRAGKSASSVTVKDAPSPSARRLSVEEIDRQAAEQGAALLRLAGEVAARQKQEAAREAQSSPMERLASEMAADRQERARRAAAPTAALQAARPRSLGEMGQTAAAYQARQVSTQSSIPQSRAPVGGRLPGTSGGAAPLTAASFGGVTGYRNIAPVRQEQPGGLRRVAAGTDAAVSGLLGGIGSAVETGKAALGGQADFFSDVGLKGYLTTPLNQLGEARQRPEYQRQMDMDSAAARLMERAAEKTGEAVEGLGPKASWVAENLISAGQNVPAMAAALVPAVGPALSGGMMAASAGGSRAFELQQQGADAGEAFWRGAVSGGIELATEKLSIDNFLEIAKGTGAKNAVQNLLRQMGVEASEEGASYALNFIADKAARDPHAEFSLAELANSAAGGAFSGGIYGGAGLAVNRLLYAPQAARQAQDTAQSSQAVQQAQNQAQAAPVRSAYAVQKLGENGLKNYQFLRERDGGKTPDFDAQHAHYYNAARSGMAVDRIPAYPSMTPLDEQTRRMAALAGQNDLAVEAADTISRLFDGRAVSDTALDRVLAYPKGRRAVENVTGPLPQSYAQARQQAREWVQANVKPQAAQDNSGQAADTLPKSAETLPKSSAAPTVQEAAPRVDAPQAAREITSETAQKSTRQARERVPGLVRNEHSAALEHAEAERVDRIAKRFGVEVEFSDRVQGEGQYQDGRITISRDAKSPARRVLVHELTHHLETGEMYRAFSDAVAGEMKRGGADLDAQLALITKDYRENGVYLSEDGARRELVAKWAEDNLFTNSESVRRLAGEHRGIAQRVLDWLRDVAVKLTGTQEEKFIRKAEKMYTEALGEAQGRQTGETQHSIETLPDGKLYVKADRQVIHGEDSGQWLKQAERFINEKIRKGGDITVFSADGHALQITERSAYKLTDPHVQSIQKAGRAELTGEKLALKSRIAGHIDEVIGASRKFKNRPDVNHVHQNDIGEDGFNYYAAYFEDNDGQYYRVVFSSAINGAVETAYSIGKTGERKHPASNGSSAPTEGDGAQAAAVLSENSIAQPAPDSKTQHSYGGTLSELNERLASMTEEEKKALVEENRRQAKRIERLEKQLTRTPDRKRNEQQTRRITKEVLAQYASKADAGEVTRRLQWLFDQTHGDVMDTAMLYHTALETAGEIVRESSVLMNEEALQYRELRKQLRETRLTLGEDFRADLRDGYKETKARVRGVVRLVDKGGMPIDTMYEQLRADYGEAFFPADITHPADRLERIAEIAESLKPVYGNPYANGIGEAANQLALELMEYAAQAEAAPETVADRAAGRTRALNELAYERERRKKETAALKAHYAEMDQKRRQRQSDRADREALLRVARRVNRMQASPANRALIENLIGELDLCGVSIRKDTELHLVELRKKLLEAKRLNPEWDQNPRLMQELNERLDGMKIADMDIGDVRTLTDALLALETQVYNEKRMLQTKDRRDAYTQAQESVKSIQQAGAPKNNNSFKNKYLSAMLSPERFARRLVGYDESSPLYQRVRDIADGQRKAQDFRMRSERFFDRWHSDRAFMEKLTGKKAALIDVRGMAIVGGKLEPVRTKITPAQQVSLYLHAKHPANRRHILEGGVTIPDAALYAKGKLKEAYNKSVRVRLDEAGLRSLTVNMDSDVRAYAERVSEYLNGMAKDAINETSVVLDGYERATVNRYYPIKTDPNYSRAEYEGEIFDATIEGWGNLKNRQSGTNPIQLTDVFDVLNHHMEQTATYYGVAIPVRNLKKLLNVTGTDSEWSVKDALQRKWGDGAEEYLRKMIVDVQGQKGGESSFLGRTLASLRSKSAGAVLTMNFSVIMKQAASYPTASGEIGWAPLIKALNPKAALSVDIETIAKYTPDYWYRRKGYSTMELGDIASRKKGLPKALNLIQGVDLATTRTLWAASEHYVREQNKGKADAPGIRSDAYYRQVAEVYNRVIEHTQPNYAAMQRPGILRSGNELEKALVMFKTQSFQNFNLLYDSFGEWRANARRYALDKTDGNREALRESRRKMARQLSAQAVSAAVFSGMTLAAAALTGKKKRYEDEDGEITWASLLAQFSRDMASSVAGMALGGSELFSAADSLLLGGQWYDIDVGGVSSFNDMMTMGKSLQSALDSLTDALADPDEEISPAKWQRLALSGWKFGKAVLEKGCGIPAGNAETDLLAVVSPVLRKAFGEYTGAFYRLLVTKDADKDSGAYIDLLYQAYKAESPEYESLHELVNGLGIDDEKIASAIERREGAGGILKSLLKARRGGDTEAAEDFRRQLLDGGLKTEREIRDSEHSADQAAATELVEAAYLARRDGETALYEENRQMMLNLEYTEEEIDDWLYSWYLDELEGTDAFEAAYDEISVRMEDEGKRLRGYEALDRNGREAFLKNVKSYSREAVRMEQAEDYEPKTGWYASCREAPKACGLSESLFLIAYAAQSGAEGIPGADGKAISGSKGLCKMQAINQIPGLDDKQKRYMYEACGVGKKVIGFNPGRVNQELDKMEKQAAK